VIEKTVRVTNRLGIHARPAAMLVQKASKFKSEIRLVKGTLEVNAKSIMGVMMLAAECGSKLFLRAWGPDAEQAVAELTAIFESKFNEE
jgi:phosphocarrier protein